MPKLKYTQQQIEDDEPEMDIIYSEHHRKMMDEMDIDQSEVDEFLGRFDHDWND